MIVMNNEFKKRKLLRLRQILGCEKRKIQPIVPISKSAWYSQIRKGNAPQSVKINGASNWYEDEIYAFVESLSGNPTAKAESSK